MQSRMLPATDAIVYTEQLHSLHTALSQLTLSVICTVSITCLSSLVILILLFGGYFSCIFSGILFRFGEHIISHYMCHKTDNDNIF